MSGFFFTPDIFGYLLLHKKFYCTYMCNCFCFSVGSHWLEHSVQMLKSGKAELVHEVDETFIDLRTSLEDINNKSKLSLQTVFLIIQ